MLINHSSLAQLRSHARRRSSQLVISISPRVRWFILIALVLPVLFVVLIRINSASAQTLLSFGTATPYGVGAGPYWGATFTKFGKPGVAVTNQDGNSVSVLYGTLVGGQFNGTFGAATTYNLNFASVPTPGPQQVVVGNLGQLPLPCLVIAAAGANRVAVLLGNSDDSFQPTPVYYNVGNFPESVALGDVNGDANLDIIAANYGSSTISVLLGNSDRTFQSQQTYATSPNPESVVVADFNNDGKLDVATVNSGTNPGKVNVLLNVNGTFPNALTSDVGLNPFSLAVGDFNSDGKVDIVAANNSGGISVLLNNGVRPFPTAAPAPINAGSAPFSVAVADFNLDGRPDIAVSNSDNGGSVGILPNNNGSFQALQASDRFPSGPNPQFIASGDFNTDGKPDLVVPNHPSPAVNPGTINVLLNTAAPFVAPPPNDNFASAIPLPQTVSGRVTGSNDGATHETNEPQHAGRPGTKSVWYTWAAPATGGATFDTFASTFDTALAVYTGPGFGALTEIASGDNDRGGNGESRVTSRVKFSAIAGTTYRIAVDSGGGGTESGAITLNWSQLPPPSNDNFVKRQVISGSTGAVTNTNAGATKEAGEPNHAGAVGGSSIWYQWTAPSSGNFTFSTAGSSLNGGFGVNGLLYDTLLAIYTGTSVNGLVGVVSNDDANQFTPTSLVTLAATQGTTYQIALDSKGTAKSDITLSWSPVVVSTPHDTFPTALAISGESGSASSVVGTNNQAWFRWVAPADGRFSFSSRPFNLLNGQGQTSSSLTIFIADSQNNLTTVATSGFVSCRFGLPVCDDAVVQFDATQGSVYGIRVSGVSGSNDASLSWSKILAARPPNDDLAKALLIKGFVGLQTFSNTGATSESGEPAHAGQPASHSLWYSWTALDNFEVKFQATQFFSTGRGDYGTPRFGIYTGSSYPLTQITGGLFSVTFTAVKNTTYRIALDYNDTGSASFSWINTGSPLNDNFSSSQVISGNSGSVLGTNANATEELNEPNHAGKNTSHSIWYSWTPSVTGPVTFNTDGSFGGFGDPVLAIYTGSSVSSLSEVVSNDDVSLSPRVTTSGVTFLAIAGTQYRIAVDSEGFTTGGIVLNWGTPRSISGRLTDIRGVGIANVQVALSGFNDDPTRRAAITDTQGAFRFPDLVQGGTYIVTPSTTLFFYDHDFLKIPLSLDKADANFVAKTPTYSIAGQIKVNGVGIDNIPVTLTGTNILPGETVLTTEGGNYSFIELPTNGDYKVTPSSSLYAFSADIYPANNFYEYKTLNESKKGADFTATSLPQTLTVVSVNPSDGVVIGITPNDNGALGGGPTPLTRAYNPGTQVTLTAPPTAGGNNFQKWLRNGADFSTNPSTSITMDTNYTMTAVYLTLTRTLTVASNPANGISITVTPSDKNSQGNGTTQFTRTYNINQKVSLTAPATNGNNTFQKWLKDGAGYSNDLTTDVTLDADHTMTAVYVTTSAQTPPGQNVSVQLNGVTVGFSNVTTAGTTTITSIAPASAGQLPTGFQLTGNSLAFDISTTAVVQPPISVCFNVPSVTDPALFGQLRILHPENGALVDRTSSQNFATKMICATVNSLSPFVLVSSTVQQLDLLLEESTVPSTQVTALDALLMLRDPFPVVSPGNPFLGADKNTRVVVLVRNLLPGTTATVHLVDAAGQTHDVTATDQRLVSGFEFSQVTFRLPDSLASGSCSIEIRAQGLVSNLGTIRIK